ncbi:MAG: DEAD/DEAH box helicase [Deltaproteobacteria bacterium]|nr:DEAD/DEAH box helicase [Deltaproteobacteria bacterium]
MHRTIAKHQEVAIRRLQTWWKSKAESKAHGFVAMPTGSGKTFTAVRFAVSEIFAKRRGPCVVWVAHNEFLLQQAEREFQRQLEEHGLSNEVVIGRARGDGQGADAGLIFAMIQTLSRGDAVTAIKRAGEVDLVIFDEFHRLAADTWSDVPKKFKRSKIRTLGLSATPFRKTPAKTDLLREILPHRIYSVGLTELVKDRFLAEPTVTRVLVENQRPVEFTSKELSHLRQFQTLSASALERISLQSGRDQLILDTYRRNPGRYQSTIIFCCSVDHAMALAATFSASGIRAESICGSSRNEVNQEKLAAFRAGEFPVATSVILLTEGVDVPRCRTVFLARPTESPVLLAQMIGRAMRGIPSGGSASCNVVDFVDNLGENLDLAASHFAFVREYDEAIRPLVKRPPREGAAGISMSLLLRVREFLTRHIVSHGGVENLGIILHEEIAGWLERWDGEVHRVLLVPHSHATEIVDALEETETRVQKLPLAARESEASEYARAVYDDHSLDAFGVSEEDFVSMASAGAADRTALTFHALEGRGAVQDNKAVCARAGDALVALERDLKPTGSASDFTDAFAAIRGAVRSR